MDARQPMRSKRARIMRPRTSHLGDTDQLRTVVTIWPCRALLRRPSNWSSLHPHVSPIEKIRNIWQTGLRTRTPYGRSSLSIPNLERITCLERSGSISTSTAGRRRYQHHPVTRLSSCKDPKKKSLRIGARVQIGFFFIGASSN